MSGPMPGEGNGQWGCPHHHGRHLEIDTAHEPPRFKDTVGHYLRCLVAGCGWVSKTRLTSNYVKEMGRRGATIRDGEIRLA